jgi:hypothetical protein
MIVNLTLHYPCNRAILRDVPPHPSGSALSMYIGSSNDVPLINYTRSILDFYGNFTNDRYRFCKLLQNLISTLQSVNV